MKIHRWPLRTVQCKHSKYQFLVLAQLKCRKHKEDILSAIAYPLIRWIESVRLLWNSIQTSGLMFAEGFRLGRSCLFGHSCKTIQCSIFWRILLYNLLPCLIASCGKYCISRWIVDEKNTKKKRSAHSNGLFYWFATAIRWTIKREIWLQRKLPFHIYIHYMKFDVVASVTDWRFVDQRSLISYISIHFLYGNKTTKYSYIWSVARESIIVWVNFNGCWPEVKKTNNNKWDYFPSKPLATTTNVNSSEDVAWPLPRIHIIQ